jgi:transposase
MNERQEREGKALVIAAKSKLTKKGDKWHVPSASGYAPYYEVDPNPRAPHCTCPDFEKRGERCKHIYAVEIVIERESSTTTIKTGDTTTTTTTETVKIRYKQMWRQYNSAQTNEKADFLKLLHALCANVDEPIQMMGRTRLPMGDMLFATVYKVYAAVSSRRFMTDLKEAYVRRYISKLPCFNSVNHYLDMPELTPYLQWLIVQSSLPLKAIETDFAVDSSGFSTCNYVRWFDEKYGKEKSQHDWVKAHIICGVKTNIVTSVEVGGAHSADPNYFAPLVNETKKRFDVKEVSADKAYSSYANMRLVDNIGAVPYIDFKTNASDSGKCEIWNKMFHYYSMNKTEFMSHYHKRSNVETTFSMVKAKFGGSIRSKIPVAQTNEVLCKFLAHNLCCLIQSMYELGIEPNFMRND